ncbi:hypothetical protein KBB96_09440 [Luteolibacter ambystomatis]|uniref:Uncharacterized protein n=1 Tax=Luteolibacter ambystomatis TaxID=2824561 RepID=A0A975J347_9BACT|nr:hypothetical protein [Luteolibacter ambystomatis]QUE53102.1 hypothetical protein KBB96_09440 [Luteolibacter ambystomatis]
MKLLPVLILAGVLATAGLAWHFLRPAPAPDQDGKVDSASGIKLPARQETLEKIRAAAVKARLETLREARDMPGPAGSDLASLCLDASMAGIPGGEIEAARDKGWEEGDKLWAQEKKAKE